MHNIQPVIMAGGFGRRLWPLSTTSCPKQFCKFGSNFSFFQDTIIRNYPLGKPIIIVNKNHLEISIKQINQLSIQCDLIIEDKPRGTAICAFLAAKISQQRNLNCVVLIPSDHIIHNQHLYLQTILQASKLAKQAEIVTIGLEANAPNVDYGYIHSSSQIAQNIYLSKAFIEKPSLEKATQYIDTREFFWNSGIFLYNPEKLLTSISNICSNYYSQIEEIWNSKKIADHLTWLCADLYRNLQSKSFDNDFVAHIHNMLMVKGMFHWQDIGSLKRLLQSVIASNTQIHKKNSSNCWIRHDKTRTFIMSVQNLLILSGTDYLISAKQNNIDELIAKIANLKQKLDD